MKKFRKSQRGLTLIELLCVLVIVAVLVSLTAPSYQKILRKTDSVKCASNLRQLGIAVNLAANDNDGEFPHIETSPTDPIYPADFQTDNPPKSLLETLEPYGINADMLKCPADLRVKNRFKELGSSYEWRPLIDGESTLSPQLLTRRGIRSIRPSKFRLLFDVDPIHNGRQNRLYADGHVRSY